MLGTGEVLVREWMTSMNGRVPRPITLSTHRPGTAPVLNAAGPFTITSSPICVVNSTAQCLVRIYPPQPLCTPPTVSEIHEYKSGILGYRPGTLYSIQHTKNHNTAGAFVIRTGITRTSR